MVQLAFMDRSGKISQTMTTWWKASYSALTCGASLAINCCAAWQLSSFLTLTQSLLLLFHTHCPVWCLIFFTNPSYLLPLFPSSLTLSVAVSFSPSVAPVPFSPPHVQPFTALRRSPRLASFPSCSRSAQMDREMNLVSCNIRTPRE